VAAPWKRREPLKVLKQRFIPEDWILAVPDDGSPCLLNVSFPAVKLLKQRQTFYIYIRSFNTFTANEYINNS
jgi:hypothetical protein